MAEPLKNFFDPRLVRQIAAMLRAAWPAFPEKRFITEAAAGLDALELIDRARHITAAMRRALPDDSARAIEILITSLGPEHAGAASFGMTPFLYMPHAIYVAEHGLGCFDVAMRANYEITKRFTAEFSIRPFLEHHQAPTLALLRRWATDPNVHVRRLVSEGTRPRLPWASRLRAFQRDPQPVLALLELLKDDPELYVRRSVANNLNDIGKDHPALLVEVCARWSEGAGPERRWIVAHALRSAVKRGDPKALAVLGFRGKADLAIDAAITPRRLRVGDKAKVTLTVKNPSKRAQRAVVDLAVHFVKKSGDAKPKVFKVRSVDLAPGEEATIAKTISFQQHTTRTHYAGRHQIDVLVNGEARTIGHIDVSDG